MLNQSLKSSLTKEVIDEFKQSISQINGYENSTDYVVSVNKLLENLQYKLGVSTNLTLANLAFFPLKETSEGNYKIDQENFLNSSQKLFLENCLSQIIQGNYTSIENGVITSPEGYKYALGNMIKLEKVDGKPIANFAIASGNSEVYVDGVSQFSRDQSLFELKSFEEITQSSCENIDLSKLNPEETRIVKHSVDECLDRFVSDASSHLVSQDSLNSLRKISLLRLSGIADSLNQTVSEFSSSSLALGLNVKSDNCNITDFFAIEDLPRSDNASYGDLEIAKSTDEILKEFSKKFLESFVNTKEISQFIAELKSRDIDASIIEDNQPISQKLNQNKIFVFDNILSIIQTELNKKANLAGNSSCGIIFSRDLAELCVDSVNSSSIATNVCVDNNPVYNSTANISPTQTSFAEIYLNSSRNISEVNETSVDENPELTNPDETPIFDDHDGTNYSLLEFEKKFSKNFLIEVPPAFFSALMETSLSYNKAFKSLSFEAQNLILSTADQSARLGSFFYFSDNIEKSLIGLGSAQLANGLFKIAKVNKTSKSFMDSAEQLALKNSYIKYIKTSYDSLPSGLREGMKGFAFVALYQSIIQGITTSKDDEETYQSRVATATAVVAVTAIATGLMRGLLKMVINEFKSKSAQVEANSRFEPIDYSTHGQRLSQEEARTPSVGKIDYSVRGRRSVSRKSKETQSEFQGRGGENLSDDQQLSNPNPFGAELNRPDHEADLRSPARLSFDLQEDNSAEGSDIPADDQRNPSKYKDSEAQKDPKLPQCEITSESDESKENEKSEADLMPQELLGQVASKYRLELNRAGGDESDLLSPVRLNFDLQSNALAVEEVSNQDQKDPSGFKDSQVQTEGNHIENLIKKRINKQKESEVEGSADDLSSGWQVVNASSDGRASPRQSFATSLRESMSQERE